MYTIYAMVCVVYMQTLDTVHVRCHEFKHNGEFTSKKECDAVRPYVMRARIAYLQHKWLEYERLLHFTHRSYTGITVCVRLDISHIKSQ